MQKQIERWPDLDITGLRCEGLGARDAAFANAIYDAVLRRWLTIEGVLRGKLRQPLHAMTPAARAVLMVGTAQILFLDRVPPHAAINEAVEWAKRHLSGSLAGMTNGVLRNVARAVLTRQDAEGLPRAVRRERYESAPHELPMPDGSSLLLKDAALPADPTERLAAAVSCPVELVRRWEERHGQEAARRWALHLLCPPPTTLNIAHAAGPLPDALLALSIPHGRRGSRVWTGPREELVRLLRARPDVWVQDASASRAVAGLADLEPMVGGGVVVDLCAGLGTKTRQLAAVFPRATVIACDPDERRAEALGDLAASNPRVRVIASADVGGEYLGNAALVLADVPCSNTGVLARRVEARYRWSDQTLARMVEVQRAILRQAAALVKPGGVLVYSTCSVDREENEDQAAWASAELGLRLGEGERADPAGLPGDPPVVYADGAFSVRLVRA